jgi:hypothetical protein
MKKRKGRQKKKVDLPVQLVFQVFSVRSFSVSKILTFSKHFELMLESTGGVLWAFYYKELIAETLNSIPKRMSSGVL